MLKPQWIPIGISAFMATCAHAQNASTSLSAIGVAVQDASDTLLSLEKSGPDGILDQRTGMSRGSRFVRLKLSASPTGANSSATIEVQSGLGIVDDVIPVWELSNKPYQWTKMIPGEDYRLIVKGTPAAGVKIKVEAVLRTGEPAEILSSTPTTRPQPISTTTTTIRKVGRGVVQIIFDRANTTYSCTGFLVAKDKLVTNEHCISSAADCDTALALFDRDTERMVRGNKQRRCTRILVSDKNNDFALLQLDENAEPDITPLELADNSPLPGNKLLVIQHPGGGVKQVADFNCLSDANPVPGHQPKSNSRPDFLHTCGTWSGASGAPVLDAKSLKVVGLHHLGFTQDQPKFNRAVRVEQWLPAVQAHIQSATRP